MGHGGLQRTFCFAASVLSNYRLLGIQPDITTIGGTIVFLWSTYAYDYLLDCRSEGDMKNNPERSKFYSKNYSLILSLIVTGGIACMVAVLACLYNGRIGGGCLLTVASMAAIAITYPLKLLPGGKPLKAIPGMKLFQIGSFYALVSMLMAQVAGMALGMNVLHLALAFGTWAMSAANVSDIHDIEGDRAEGIVTLPVLWGAQAAWVASLAGSIAASLLLWMVSPSAASAVTGAMLVGMTASIWPHLPPLPCCDAGSTGSVISSPTMLGGGKTSKKKLLRLRKYDLLAFSLPTLLIG